MNFVLRASAGFPKMEESKDKEPRIFAFAMLSFCIHLAVLAGQAMLPANEKKIIPNTPPPIEVSFVDPKPEKESGKKIVIDTPPPEVIEKPNTMDFLSNTDSRAHGNLEPVKADEYRNNKTMIPKATQPPMPEKTVEKPPVKEKKPAPKKQVDPEPQERGIIEPPMTSEPEVKVVEKKPELPKSAYALLDGFDASKYASLDTKNNSTSNADDNKPISLDTTETKYVSYFARIKRQIERVWVYPVEAAQRGINGELTLRFQISRDGNLMGIVMVDKSGYEILDMAALKAVRGAAPFYPIPSTIDKDSLIILATFVYSPSFSSR
jgi:protein TonB